MQILPLVLASKQQNLVLPYFLHIVHIMQFQAAGYWVEKDMCCFKENMITGFKFVLVHGKLKTLLGSSGFFFLILARNYFVTVILSICPPPALD